VLVQKQLRSEKIPEYVIKRPLLKGGGLRQDNASKFELNCAMLL